MTSISKLKKSSVDMSRLVKEIEKINSGGERETDARFWQPEVDKAGNGGATIRFLPAPAVDGDDALPWVRVFRHAFQGPTGKWYIENSLTTLNQKDPVSEFNSELWKANESDDSPERKQARKQKRKLEYIANILVVKDAKGREENEGKVFLFKFGKKIFDKITAAMNPGAEDVDDEGEPLKPINPFDAWEGANFKLIVRQKDGYRNYDTSKFLKPTPIAENDEEIEAIWNTEYSLKEFLDPSKFKSYDELKKRLNDVINAKPTTTFQKATAAPASKKEDLDEDIPFDVEEEDDDLKAFKSLIEDDE